MQHFLKQLPKIVAKSSTSTLHILHTLPRVFDTPTPPLPKTGSLVTLPSGMRLHKNVAPYLWIWHGTTQHKELIGSYAILIPVGPCVG